ncbi:unnamed protein product [Acanthoscelides obtectus]|uniref:Uncharacterized protein n=1 Tax=Acanthoscelides obtectus TaxID=200917 RepID=A0A9P0KDW9_ACAOB|nr:unnamed protein product [Acanthoscelides obtectus]CAK1632365.1 hypothetical protein AOBTE_LOCUS7507 [Acanthoscelides obtectus]
MERGPKEDAAAAPAVVVKKEPINDDIKKLTQRVRKWRFHHGYGDGVEGAELEMVRQELSKNDDKTYGRLMMIIEADNYRPNS